MCRWLSELFRAKSPCAKALLLVTWFGISCAAVFADDKARPHRIDPGAWGDDHVGKPLPSYVTGDECLFCHRDIGPAWSDNRHQRTIRLADATEPAMALLRDLEKGAEFADVTSYLLGTRRITRFLKRSKDYGKLELLSTSFHPRPNVKSREETGRLSNHDAPHWDPTTFGDRCAGCHTTAVRTETRAFSAVGTDCFACHGSVDLQHSKDVSKVLLSNTNRKPREIVSICGQCHLRGGKSKSSNLPYPNTFVAGDNLFRDFQVDFSSAAIKALPLVEQHIYLNARDIAVLDQSAVTCLTCHAVHKQSSEKHQLLEGVAICASCHLPGTDHTTLRDGLLPPKRLQSHSRVCDY